MTNIAIENGGSFHSYVKLPEGSLVDCLDPTDRVCQVTKNPTFFFFFGGGWSDNSKPTYPTEIGRSPISSGISYNVNSGLINPVYKAV